MLRACIWNPALLPAQSTGDQALELLQHLCANDLDVPVGHIVHTGMLNAKGGYENDCSVVRLSKNRLVTLPPTHTRPNATVDNKLKDFSSPLRSFFIVSPTDQQVHCWNWIKKHMPSDPQLHLEDVSWKYTGKSWGQTVTKLIFWTVSSRGETINCWIIRALFWVSEKTGNFILYLCN